MSRSASEMHVFSIGRIAYPTVPRAAAQTQFAFSLADLQAAAADQFGMSGRETLAAAVALYEKGLISYPYVDDRWLPESQFEATAELVRNFQQVSGCREYDPAFQGSVWFSETQGAHTGITLTSISAAAVFGLILPEPESRIYSLVHERILSLFKRPAPSPAGR